MKLKITGLGTRQMHAVSICFSVQLTFSREAMLM